MSKFPDDDELLSAIIDGEASAESIASVEADPERSQRLADMRAAVEVVATPAPEATAERRSASIAAAMAAATPASPEVASLAAQRHKREENKRAIPASWIAAAAAVILFVFAIPFLFGTGGETDSVVADVADAADGSAEVEAFEDEATSESLNIAEEDEEEAMEDEEEVVEEAQEDAAEEEEIVEEEEAAEAAEAAAPAAADDDGEAAEGEAFVAVAQSVEELDALIAEGSLAPVLVGDDLLAREAPVTRSGDGIGEALATAINPECVANADTSDVIAYDLAVLDPFAGAARLVIIEFTTDQMSRVLDAETCEIIR